MVIKMIEIKNYTKIYAGSKKAVDNISLTINDGEIFAFIGHNGARKNYYNKIDCRNIRF